GDLALLVPLGAELGQPVVGRAADERDEFRLVGDVERLPAAVRLRRGRAPPVVVVPAGAPAATVELAQRGEQDLGLVVAGHPLLVPPDRQLPAHVRLVLQRVYAVAQGLRVESAAVPAGEARIVVEDAGSGRLAQGGTPGRALPVDRVQFGPVLESAPVVLPGVPVEPPDRPPYPLLVVTVGEEGPVRAAAFVRPPGD